MIPNSNPAAKAPRHAATLLVLRDAPGGMEVLMLQRPERADDSFGGAYVFPGGVLEDNDRRLYGCCAGMDDGAASQRLGLEADGLAYFVAAIRECFEEAGLLFAYDADSELVDLDRIDRLDGALLAGLRAGTNELGTVCRQLKLRLAVDQLAYHSHWLTPLDQARRFDTRFFVAVAPPAQTARHDGREAMRHVWLRPADALARADEYRLLRPTLHTLRALSDFDSASACREHARGLQEIGIIMPRRARGAAGPCVLLPHEPAYAEVARLDPEGRGDASCEIDHGQAVRLSPRLIRLTAPNGNVMTGPGTNTYLVGGGAANEWAVIDPGPDMDAHVRKILAVAPGPIRWIFVTHTHRDHSPAAAPLKRLTGAQLLGQRAPAQEWQDSSFLPDRQLAHGERIALDDAATLRALHTPGHASNHLCYLLVEERTLFTGDHVMQGSTVVINPPDGDMATYLASLRLLLDEDLQWLAPGHGFLMDRPRQVIRKTIEHRLKREAKVAARLREMSPVDIDSLLPRVYDDVPPRMHPVAKRSLLAHLIKLDRDGRAHESEGLWRPR